MMPQFQSNFVQRHQEIQAYLDLYKKINPIDAKISYQSNSEIIDYQIEPTDKSILRATLLMLLYGLMEFTVSEAMKAIHEAIRIAEPTFFELNPAVQKTWLRYNQKTLNDSNSVDDKYLNRLNALVHLTAGLNTPFDFSFEPDADKAEADFIQKEISGSIDAKKIREIFKNYGLDLSEELIKSNFMAKIKTKRNDLAHGVLSFAKAGEDTTYSIQFLGEKTTEIIQVLTLLVEEVLFYLQNQKYLSNPPNIITHE
jgi:MAE_28990/MAE_18760-like HEPN